MIKSADIRSLIAVGSSLARCTSDKVPLEDGLMFFFPRELQCSLDLLYIEKAVKHIEANEAG